VSSASLDTAPAERFAMGLRRAGRPIAGGSGEMKQGKGSIMSARQQQKPPRQVLDFYARPAAMTAMGDHARLFESLPGDVAELSRVLQGLQIHEYMASAYGFEIPDQRRAESHLRAVGPMLERLMALDDRPVAIARPPERRLVGVCRHFTLLLVALLRARGVPARARVGFGTYFDPGQFLDHWLCEWWDERAARWVRTDAQLDDVWRDRLGIDFDVLDVPHDRFVIAGDAWAQWRTGAVDAAFFGIHELRGAWFIAGNLVRDLAALNKVEMLPWDVWGGMPQPDATLDEEALAFFDWLAALTRTPDAEFAELRSLYDGDERLRVPATVFNAVRQRPEAV